VAAGPHGADRIGGCMMTATQVFGRRAGASAAGHAKMLGQRNVPDIPMGEDIEWLKYRPKRGNSDSLIEPKLEIRKTMTRYATVSRCEDGLKKCGKKLYELESHAEEIRVDRRAPPHKYFQLRNMILTGRLIVESALKRKYSLGSHFRKDCPPNPSPPASPLLPFLSRLPGGKFFSLKQGKIHWLGRPLALYNVSILNN
jgi:fumarate reductase (CoM/CoB) subunit A